MGLSDRNSQAKVMTQSRKFLLKKNSVVTYKAMQPWCLILLFLASHLWGSTKTMLMRFWPFCSRCLPTRRKITFSLICSSTPSIWSCLDWFTSLESGTISSFCLTLDFHRSPILRHSACLCGYTFRLLTSQSAFWLMWFRGTSKSKPTPLWLNRASVYPCVMLWSDLQLKTKTFWMNPRSSPTSSPHTPLYSSNFRRSKTNLIAKITHLGKMMMMIG